MLPFDPPHSEKIRKIPNTSKHIKKSTIPRVAPSWFRKVAVGSESLTKTGWFEFFGARIAEREPKKNVHAKSSQNVHLKSNATLLSPQYGWGDAASARNAATEQARSYFRCSIFFYVVTWGISTLLTGIRPEFVETASRNCGETRCDFCNFVPPSRIGFFENLHRNFRVVCWIL